MLSSANRVLMNIEIHHALPEDADTLTEIAITAKRHWNYPERWIQIWMPQLTFEPKEIWDANIFAATINNVIASLHWSWSRSNAF